MALPESVLVDTSAFYALISATDEFHGRARAAYERLLDRDQRLWSTSYVVVETIALVHRRLGFETLRALLEFVERYVEVFWIDSSIHDAALKELVASGGSGLNFVDWTTALAAAHLGAPVFTFDEGFRRQGASVVPR